MADTYTIPGTNIQIPLSIASGGVQSRMGLPSGDSGDSMMIYSDPALAGGKYAMIDPTHMMQYFDYGGREGEIGYTLQDGKWELDPKAMSMWDPMSGGGYSGLFKALGFLAGGVGLGELAGLGAGLDPAAVYGAGSGWGGDTLSAMGLGGEGAGAGSATIPNVYNSMIPSVGNPANYSTYSMLGSGAPYADFASVGASAFPTTGAAAGSALGADIAATPWYSSLLGALGIGGPATGAGAATAAGGLGSNLGLAGGLAQLIGGLYGANQAKNISNLAQQSVPWITGGGQAQAAQQLQQALGGNVSGLPGFQLAQRAAMDKAGRQMAAGGMYGSGAYVPGMATAASGNYMNYLNMLANLAGVGTQPNYNAMQAGLGGQITGYGTALQGGLGTLGSLMSMFG